MNLPKRDELLLRVVFALPKASSTGLAMEDEVVTHYNCLLSQVYLSLHTIQYFSLYGTSTVMRIAEVFEQVLGRFGFTRTRFARDNDGLRQLVDAHVAYGLIRY